MITINTYSGKWQSALRPAAPKLGAKVKMHTSPDGREADDFSRVLRESGLELRWERAQKNGYDVYVVDTAAEI